MTPAPQRHALLIRPCGRRAGLASLPCSDYRSGLTPSGHRAAPSPLQPSRRRHRFEGTRSPLSLPTNTTQLRPGRALWVALARQPLEVTPRIWTLTSDPGLTRSASTELAKPGCVARYLSCAATTFLNVVLRIEAGVDCHVALAALSRRQREQHPGSERARDRDVSSSTHSSSLLRRKRCTCALRQAARPHATSPLAPAPRNRSLEAFLFSEGGIGSHNS